MIDKMAYVNIIGPKDGFDGAMEKYISAYPIQFENAVLELNGQEHIRPFIEANPYSELTAKADELIKKLEGGLSEKEKKHKKGPAPAKVKSDEASAVILELYDKLSKTDSELEELNGQISQIKADLENIGHFKGLDLKVEDLLSLKYTEFRFGRIPKANIANFKEYIDNTKEAAFAECGDDGEYIWGVYLVPQKDKIKDDSIFSSFRFERVRITDKYKGTPDEICAVLEKELGKDEAKAKELSLRERKILSESEESLYGARDKLNELSLIFDARSYAACTKYSEGEGSEEAFFIVCGWMRLKDADKLEAEIKNAPELLCIINRAPKDPKHMPPISLHNIAIFRPYEMFTKMYGLPSYSEFDPTMLIGILYSFIFGAMFGDLGHGMVLFIGGLLLYKLKHMQLAGIIAFAGVFSMFFGLMFGSFFGFEEIIPTLWLKPREAFSQLNMVGHINTVFALAVAFGMVLMLFLMIINIVNHAKRKDLPGGLFTANGVAGFIFYGTLVLVVFLYMFNKPLPATIIIVLLLVLSLLAIAAAEPLTALIRTKKASIGGTGIGMYCVQAFFDLFETCLTYFSNTLSFVRIGAFAVSHAAMMGVVLQLTGYENGGNGSIIGLIFGNIVVIGFEGLIVGIQVLRLQYYEVFSKFYIGDGKEFKPYFSPKKTAKKQKASA